jgi:hypothetical protein
MNLSVLPLVLVALTTLPLARPQGDSEGPPVLSLADIVLDQYAVKNVDIDELYQLANELAGREYYLKERGGEDTNLVSSLRTLGTSIVLYDTKAEVARVKDLLTRLDVREQEGASSESREYRPRFLSMDTVATAIHDMVDSSRRLEERGLIVLQGTHADVEGALELLKRIDVPDRQVLLTCQLIEVGGAQQGPPLAKELADNLQKLLPEMHFTQVGMAMLKTTTGRTDEISIQVETSGGSYLLSFQPVSFDESSGSLTISNCTLSANGGALFRTNTVLRGNEYTVLAATGATPKLLVVRIVPQP